jgi:hypothetical protein
MSSLIRPKNSLKRAITKNKIFEEIISELQKIADLPILKLDLELLSYVCNLVENLVKKKTQIDKKALVLEIFSKLFPDISTDDIQQIDKNIEYLFENGKINKLAAVVYCSKCLFEYLKKKV